MAQPTEGVCMQITMHIDETKLDEFFKLSKPIFERVTSEPECTFFQLLQSPENPSEISIVECWSKSAEWLFEVQVKKDYMKPYFEATEPMHTKAKEMKLLNGIKGFRHARA